MLVILILTSTNSFAMVTSHVSIPISSILGISPFILKARFAPYY